MHLDIFSFFPNLHWGPLGMLKCVINTLVKGCQRTISKPPKMIGWSVTKVWWSCAQERQGNNLAAVLGCLSLGEVLGLGKLQPGEDSEWARLLPWLPNVNGGMLLHVFCCGMVWLVRGWFCLEVQVVFGQTVYRNPRILRYNSLVWVKDV